MDRFVPQQDELGNLINAQASALHERLVRLDAAALGMPEHCLAYFQSSHSERLFFSIETSGRLLYRAITLTAKRVSDITVMDYGAGVGTLFLLAKMIGCKKVIYNDHLDDWRLSAQLIAEAIGITIDEYIVGDIDQCLDRLAELEWQCDLITSRNVLEHIYKLDVFYDSVHRFQPRSVIFSSTTANKQNPASVVKHIRWHQKWEKIYRGKRAKLIGLQAPGLSSSRIKLLARATRGLAVDDLSAAIENYRKSGLFPRPGNIGSNTCDPENGVWAEHLIGRGEYRRLINENNYIVSFESGFWDTHYQKNYMNAICRALNRVIATRNSVALRVAPFFYVIAIPRANKL